MGSGIAQAAAAAGKRVLLYEPDEGPLQRSRAALAEALERAVSRGRLERSQADATTERISYTTNIEDLAPASALIEAVVEDLGVKRELFARLDAAAPDAAFLASNTSSIPIGELAAATTRPERVLGVHFFSPVPVMKLVEIVVALETAPATIASNCRRVFWGSLGHGWRKEVIWQSVRSKSPKTDFSQPEPRHPQQQPPVAKTRNVRLAVGAILIPHRNVPDSQPHQCRAKQ